MFDINDLCHSVIECQHRIAKLEAAQEQDWRVVIDAEIKRLEKKFWRDISEVMEAEQEPVPEEEVEEPGTEPEETFSLEHIMQRIAMLPKNDDGTVTVRIKVK